MAMVGIIRLAVPDVLLFHSPSEGFGPWTFKSGHRENGRLSPKILPEVTTKWLGSVLFASPHAA